MYVLLDPKKRLAEKKAKDRAAVILQADDVISFRQFSKKNAGDDMDEVRWYTDIFSFI